MTMKILNKIKDWFAWRIDYLVMCNPLLLILLVTVVFLGGAIMLYKTIGLPDFIPEGYVYKVEYKDWVFYTDNISHSAYSSAIRFKDTRTGDNVTIGSDYIITQVPQDHARNTTYGRDRDLPQEDSGA